MMLSVCNELNAANRQGISPKKIVARNLATILEFSQYFIQGLFERDDPLLQLPGFTQEIIKNYRR
jgi:hypothetical protein